MGQLTSEKDELDFTTTCTYDPRGNIATKTTANGDSIVFSYDCMNRTTKIDYSDDTPDVTYYFSGQGELTKTSNANVTYEYAHNSAGIRTSVTNSTLDKTLTYEYNDANKVTKKTGPEQGESFVYDYDANGRMISIGDPDNDTTLFEYSSCCQRRTKTTYANGSYSTYLYDLQGNLTRQDNRKSGCILHRCSTFPVAISSAAKSVVVPCLT
jgi:YD repeat-containing protein